MSDPQLKRWFREYNRKHFDGALPANTICVYQTIEGAHGTCIRGGDSIFVIRINPDFPRCRAKRRFDLLHEMVHVKLWPSISHGKAFDAEMLRLANAGALKGLW
jgi:hypothetical protein